MEAIIIAITGWIIVALIYLVSELRDTQRVRMLVGFFDDSRKLWSHETILWMLDRLDVDPKLLAKAGVGTLFAHRKKQAIATLHAVAAEHGRKEFLARDMLPMLFQLMPTVRGIFEQVHVDFDDLQMVSAWWGLEREKDREGLRDRFAREKPLGFNTLAGYTPQMEKYAHAVRERYNTKRSQFHLSAHEKSLAQVQSVLMQSGFNNAMLIGEPGTGKRALLFALADLIARGQAKLGLNVRRMVVLDMEKVLQDGTSQKEINRRISMLFNEAERAGNIILVIENFHEFVQTKRGLSIASAIVPHIRAQRLQLIALTTPDGFSDVIAQDKQLVESFVQLRIDEPNQRETMAILFDVLEDIEAQTESIIEYRALKTLVHAADRYVNQGKRPQKVITLVDQLMSWTGAQSAQMPARITKTHVERFLAELLGVSIGAGDEKATKKLLTLERSLHKDVVGQDNAVSAVANALRRRQTALAGDTHTIGNFLFIGPTGVGKTSVAKALAKHYYDKPGAFVYVNMAEYTGEDAVNQFIGSRDNPGGVLTNAIQAHPFSLILLDELEKTTKPVMDLLLQILDEGRLIGPRQEEIDFRNAIIIATSNAGAQMIYNSISAQEQRDNEVVEQKIIDRIIHEGTFTPEFLNRFDDIVLFHPLSTKDLRAIAKKELTAIKARMKDEHGVTISFARDIVAYVVEKGYTPTFGARQLHRVVQDTIGNACAKLVLNKTLTEGSTYKLTRADING